MKSVGSDEWDRTSSAKAIVKRTVNAGEELPDGLGQEAVGGHGPKVARFT